MSEIMFTTQNITNLNGIIDLYKNRELNVQRKYILVDMLKTLEISILDLKTKIKTSKNEKIRYFDNLINYFYHILESIDEQINRLDYLEKKAANKNMDEIENRISFLKDSVNKIIPLIYNKEEIQC